jgi:hypothetical protein
MLKDFEPLPADMDASRRALIHLLQGQIVIDQMRMKIAAQTIEWLKGPPDLPPLRVANENGDSSVPGEDLIEEAAS